MKVIKNHFMMTDHYFRQMTANIILLNSKGFLLQARHVKIAIFQRAMVSP